MKFQGILHIDTQTEPLAVFSRQLAATEYIILPKFCLLGGT